jgi:hypothetical protein
MLGRRGVATGMREHDLKHNPKPKTLDINMNLNVKCTIEM